MKSESTFRVMTVFGTRPEAIKMAPLVQALAAAPDFDARVVVTAQHRTMLDQVLDLFGISPHHDLDIQRDRQTLAGVTQRVLEGLDRIMTEDRPDMVVVQGDTTTTLAGALAAFYHQIPVAHLEAGLRTGDRYSPFPEEMNRILTTRLSDLHLAPTPASAANLAREGIAPDRVVCTGNSVIDALFAALELDVDYCDPQLADLDDSDRPVLLVTAHRRESWGEPMVAIGRALARLAKAEPELRIVFPIHMNPVVREAILPAIEGLANLTVTEPLPYGSFCRLMARSHIILTDSGGVQEEGPSLGKPVLVMRDTTERPEALAAGTARLVGTDEDRIADSVLELLHSRASYEQMAQAVNPYGDGRAVERTMAALRHHFGTGPAAEDFHPAVSLAAVS